MDQSSLVEGQIDDGRRFVEQFAADGNLVQAAFWVKTEEDGIWFLYVATELYDHAGPAAAYRAVHASLKKLGDSWVAGSAIKIISPSSPIAKDILAIMDRYSGRLATLFGGVMLSSMAVEQAYIYAPRVFTFTQPNPMTSEEVGREILRLVNRNPGVLHPSPVNLKDGTAFKGVPFSLELRNLGNQRDLVVQFVADGEAAPRAVPLTEIASIR